MQQFQTVLGAFHQADGGFISYSILQVDKTAFYLQTHHEQQLQFSLTFIDPELFKLENITSKPQVSVVFIL